VLDKGRKKKRQEDLFNQALISRDDFDTAQAAYDASVASQKAIEAQLDSAYAKQKADDSRLVQARASLDTAKVNLDHTIITSPISGTIISRSIDRGQTVAASFSSPTLFTIGEDLTKMQVNTNIDIHCRRVSGGDLHRDHQSSPTCRHNRPERRYLQRDHRCSQSAVEAEAGHDGERKNSRG